MDRVYNAGIDTAEGLSKYFIIQDVTSISLLLSIISQSATLLHRGQLFPQLPSFSNSPTYCLVLIVLVITHGLILYVRGISRPEGLRLFASLHWSIWVAIGVFQMVGVMVGFIVNYFDSKHYRRHLQFLRLEFDTRLGMHSPR